MSFIWFILDYIWIFVIGFIFSHWFTVFDFEEERKMPLSELPYMKKVLGSVEAEGCPDFDGFFNGFLAKRFMF